MMCTPTTTSSSPKSASRAQKPLRNRCHQATVFPAMKTFVIAVIFSLAGCIASPPAPISQRPNLGVSNGSTLTVTLVVNGRRVADFPAGGPYPTIDTTALPALPWEVQALSPSGRVLTSMHVAPGQVWSTTGPGGVVTQQGSMGRVDLSCGTLRIWAGDFAPSGPVPAASPGTPGDCEP